MLQLKYVLTNKGILSWRKPLAYKTRAEVFRSKQGLIVRLPYVGFVWSLTPTQTVAIICKIIKLLDLITMHIYLQFNLINSLRQLKLS